MVHTFKMFDKYIALDVNSGCVHDMDKLSYDIINFLNVKNFAPTSSEAKFKLIDDLKYDYDRGEISDALADIAELYENGMLWAKDDFEIASNLKENAPVKAMCLHVSHDCNLRCKYCFADEGKYHTEKRELMTAEDVYKRQPVAEVDKSSRPTLTLAEATITLGLTALKNSGFWSTKVYMSFSSIVRLPPLS